MKFIRFIGAGEVANLWKVPFFPRRSGFLSVDICCQACIDHELLTLRIVVRWA